MFEGRNDLLDGEARPESGEDGVVTGNRAGNLSIHIPVDDRCYHIGESGDCPDDNDIPAEFNGKDAVSRPDFTIGLVKAVLV